MTRLPTVSAVVVSNRPLEVIEPALRAALKDPGVIEVLLVVDGPAAGTLGPALDAFDAAQMRLRVLRMTSAGGAGLARRIGAEAALGEIVWLLDDDVVPQPDCGRGHAIAHHETGADVVLGDLPMDISLVGPPPAALYEEARVAEWRRFANDPGYILRAFWSGNFSIRREVILRLPEIDAAFRWTYHNDRAFGLECCRLGLRAVLRTELKSVHRYQRNFTEWRVDCRRQGAGTRALHDLYSDLLGPMDVNRWSNGLGRRGRVALALARRGTLVSSVAEVLALATRLAARLGYGALAIRFARILRSVEQQRGVEHDHRLGRPSWLGPRVVVADPPVVPADVSLLIVSAGPEERLRSVLRQWRPHVVEIVVIVDVRFSPNLPDDIGDLVDRCATVAAAFPVESVLPYAWTLCSRPFVLRVDDDEVPGETILAELRSLTLDGSLDQAAFSIRWCWGNAGTWIDAYPWAANPQPRLIRNRPGLIRFPKVAHSAEHLDAPVRALSGALYHLRTLDPLEDRRRHVVRYAKTTRPHLDGTPANREYLPEESNPPTLPVPFWDKSRIDAVVATKRPSLNIDIPTAAAVHPTDGGQLEAQHPRLYSGGCGAILRLRRRVQVVRSDAHLILEMVIANNSPDVLPANANQGPLLSVATRWTALTPQPGEERAVEGQRLPLGEAIPPGRAILVVRNTPVPARAGRWHVEVDLVEDGVKWFGTGDNMVIEVLEPPPEI